MILWALKIIRFKIRNKVFLFEQQYNCIAKKNENSKVIIISLKFYSFHSIMHDLLKISDISVIFMTTFLSWTCHERHGGLYLTSPEHCVTFIRKVVT